MLIAARAVLGIAAATLAPSTLSLIRNMFLDERQRTFAVGVWIASFSAGGAIGPLIGGALLSYFWWGSVFLVAVPIMALLLILGPMFLPEYRDPAAGRLDIVSAALSLASVLAMIFGIKQAAENGFNLPMLLSIAIGIALAILFVRRQRSLAIRLSIWRCFGGLPLPPRSPPICSASSLPSALSCSLPSTFSSCWAFRPSRPGCGQCPRASLSSPAQC